MPLPLTNEKLLEWKERVRLQKESGQTVAQWCRDHQIAYDSLLYWKKRFQSDTEKVLKSLPFRELSDCSITSGITIEIYQIQIHLTKNFDPATLTKCMRAIKGISC